MQAFQIISKFTMFMAFALPLVRVAPGVVKADDFANKPIRLVMPHLLDGTADVMAQVLRGPFQKMLGRSVIVD